MKKRFSFVCLLLAFILLFSFNAKTSYADEGNWVYLGGMPAGFSLSTRGAHVVGICDVVTESGLKSPAKDSGIKVGDVILYINDVEINNALDIEKALKVNGKKQISIKRENQHVKMELVPAKDMSGNYKLGVFVRDNISGIGTISFINGNRFASLGHPVVSDCGEILDIVNGDLFDCTITGFVKGERGNPGELRGVFLKKNVFASIDKNLDCGVYGVLSENFDYTNLRRIKVGVAEMGKATLFTTIDGKIPQEYDISIVKIDDDVTNKNFVIKVDDKRLLNSTGGIVQGMSGSPIIQNGKLIGAVTHVFINDPTRGFGISIFNMINN